ncbi:hypothetical protein [Riemerella columbipharyngis]|uniref:Bacteriophage CI repressor helix-turn-helix domain-containing protein n=1 Tax=Riemerella columbipharyngis TaxID=1071918 RepID=A0A1G7A196_9FLAO|nr:hypothetical protein [Riemerella columbipharyngis]SDE08684.1 hypothetical protein SAMN05421544_10313 [Riemerella columbipharyngis]
MIVDRILKIIELKNINKSIFYRETGLSNGFLDKVKDVGASKIEKILSSYPEINPLWLLTGEGEMLKAGINNNQKIKGDGNIMAGIGSNIETGDSKQTILQLKKEIKELNKRLLEKDEQINKLINILSSGK